ncbi:integumentary mucin C.1-like [Bombina bombina]|uniref:integumentary mucin C.1-like n=1 Tax=Bombina bombina TaxID=8345 RepID=UPI00235B0732|nr:integumentary mucin C.1-like [Bombina bombina]
MASKIPFILVAVILLGHQSLAKKGSNSGSKSGSNSHSHSSEEDNFLPPSGPQDCSVDPHKRRNCGYSGISAAECHTRNCCFDSSIPGVNWCFFSESQVPPSGPQDCSVDPHKRRNCGYSGISAAECHTRNCCFDSSIPGVNWCFFSKSQVPPAPSGPQDCGVDPYKRRDCGYPGISAAECHKRNCCFDSSIRGVNWCFFSESQESAQCSVDPQDRTDCGYIGISANECYSRGCCFNSSIKGVKWCFYPKPSGCYVHHNIRKDCGYPNISSKDCYSRGCCYDSSVRGTVWCYYGSK